MQQLVILVGIQASGKSTFYREMFAETHEHISKDNFKKAKYPERKQKRLLREALSDRKSVVIDNTNMSATDRAGPIAIALEFGIPVVGYVFEWNLVECMARNESRPDTERVPPVGFYDAKKRYQEPAIGEGFSSLFRVRGAPGQYRIEPYA